MVRVAQFGIVLGALGLLILVIGLFPGLLGFAPTPGVGLLQLVMILFGFSLLVLGALLYVKFTFYTNQPSNLVQQVGSRLGLTGLVFATLCGLADILGFGSSRGIAAGDIVVGQLQIAGIIGSFFLSSLGVLIYAMSGDPED
ncbi:MAG: hypothetical protein MUC99_10035 [Anaerolineae bacterium]|jgi:hypothetical protein|nr:hypothetical protein [Anaerolineae bacterium]